MKTIAWMLYLFVSTLAIAQETADLSAAQSNKLFATTVEHFSQGKYQTAIEELQEIESKLASNKAVSRQILGFVAYWKGICYNRSQDYPGAIESFGRALSYD
jgi:tetratricopeptide (TPR) repeat protein